MPNPVTGFAVNYIREKLGTEEKETEIVENTTRYSLLSRLKLLTQFGTRSMNGKAIIYPYWENIARGYEDILALLTLFGLLFLAWPVGLVLVFFCIWWKHKGWTMRDVRLKLMDKAERWVEKRREKRRKKKKGDRGNDDFEYIEFRDDSFTDEPGVKSLLKRKRKARKEKGSKPADEKRGARKEEKLRRKQEKKQKKEERRKKNGKTGGEL